MTTEMALEELDGGIEIARPEIDRRKVARYFFRGTLVTHFVLTLVTMGFWSPVLLLWVCGLGNWYAAKRSVELDYRLQPGRLLIRDGVFTKVRKTIPLDKITGVGLQQGIIDRWFGLWRVGIQTASSGQPTAEGTIFGLLDPKGFRAAVFAQRDRWLEGEDAAALTPGSPSAPRALAAAGRGGLSRPSRDLGMATVTEGGDSVERLDRIEALLAEIADNTRGQA